MKKAARRDYSLATQRVLRAIRVERDIKQTELSRRLGRYETFINLIETGQRECRIADLFAICDELGEDPIEVLTRIRKWRPTG